MASAYDIWRSTDPRDGADGSADRMPCAYMVLRTSDKRLFRCGVPYEDHNDEELGHEFVEEQDRDDD